MTNELYHYGVKGMKWGVRNDYVPVGRSRSNRFITNSGSSNSKNERIRKNSFKISTGAKVALGVAGISAATVVGLELYKLGKMNADTILRKGVKMQSIAGAEKQFGKNASFYIATGQDDRRKLIANFSNVIANGQREAGKIVDVRANMFEANRDIPIAGRKAQIKAWENMTGRKHNPFGKTSESNFNKYMFKYRTLTEEQRVPFNKQIKKMGYGGQKDLDGMAKWWGGHTPGIVYGTDAGLTQIRSSKINLDRVGKMKVDDIGGKMRKTEELGLKAVAASGIGAITVQTGHEIKKRRTKNG